MSDQRVAGWQYAGTHCRTCHEEITASDVVDVSEDGEPADDCGGWIDRTTLAHVKPSCEEVASGSLS